MRVREIPEGISQESCISMSRYMEETTSTSLQPPEGAGKNWRIQLVHE
jgi:hypothetical protein